MESMNLPGMLTPDIGLIFWMALAFIIVLLILAKFGFPAIIKMVEERQQFISESLTNARKANEELASIQAKGEKILCEAREEQAKIVKDAMATREEMLNIIRFWLRMGCDGFRVDMAGSLVKQDEDGKGTIALWKKVRKFLDEEFPDAAFVSEWGEPDKSLQGGFHMDFLLHFGPSHYNDLFRCEHPYFNKEGKGDISEFVAKYMENYEKSEKKGLICIPSGNHDMERLARQLDPEDMKIAFAFLLSMPGAPFIYYGDEIGMRYLENLTSVEGGYNRTGSRSPMQWDSGVNAGFSTAPKEKLYIQQDESADRPTVEKQQADEASLYHEVKKLIQIRQSHKALQSKGEIEFVYAEKNSYPFAYMRSAQEEKILVVLNPSGKEVRFDSRLALGESIYSYGGELKVQDGSIAVPACSANYVLLTGEK